MYLDTATVYLQGPVLEASSTTVYLPRSGCSGTSGTQEAAVGGKPSKGTKGHDGRLGNKNAGPKPKRKRKGKRR